MNWIEFFGDVRMADGTLKGHTKGGGVLIVSGKIPPSLWVWVSETCKSSRPMTEDEYRLTAAAYKKTMYSARRLAKREKEKP